MADCGLQIEQSSERSRVSGPSLIDVPIKLGPLTRLRSGYRISRRQEGARPARDRQGHRDRRDRPDLGGGTPASASSARR